MHGISPGLFPLPSDFIKSASCICISGTKSQHLHPRVTCHFLVCANERMTVRWQRLTKYVCAALFTCLYFARFLLIQGSPTIPDALEVSCAYYYSAMFRWILKLTVSLLCRGNFCLRWASVCVCAPLGVHFMISCIMISACISIHGLCIISLSNITLWAFLSVLPLWLVLMIFILA